MSKPQETNDNNSEDETAEVEDIEDLTQRLEIEAIHEARQDVMKVRNTASERLAAGDTQSESREMYVEVVKTLCIQLSPLLRQYKPELWDEALLIKDSWEAPMQRIENATGRKAVVDVSPESQTFSVHGINQLVATEFPYTVELDVTTRDTTQGNVVKTAEDEWVPSISAMDNVVIAVDEARHELGLGVSMDEGDDVWEV